MQTIDRKLLDLILEANRLRGNPASRWEVDSQVAVPDSRIGEEPSGAGSELAVPHAVVLETHTL